MPEPGVRPEHDEEVREAGHGRAEVRPRAALPELVERLPAAPAHHLADRHVRHVEAGREDDRVYLALDAVGRDDRVGAHLLDPLGHELDVLLAERAVPAVRRQDPLAADRVVGRDLLEQLGVGDLLAHVPLRHPADGLHA